MSLRLLQIVLPEGVDADVEHLVEEHEVLGRWRDAIEGDRIVIHVLVPPEEAEPIMDDFESRFKGIEGFHVLLLPVEAALPRPPEDEDKSEAEKVASKERHHRVSREELYADVNQGIQRLRIFVAMTVLSSLVAAVGLIRDDIAIIIGAMVIAPLLGPNVALALGTTLGDTGLIRRALRINLIGVGITLVISVCIGLMFLGAETLNESASVAARTNPSGYDVILGLAAGAAGTLAFTTGLSGTLIGVMVAVALMPPLVTCGMLLGAGRLLPSAQAAELTVLNVVCINLAGVATFLIQGVRPRSWWEAKKARAATRRAVIIWIVLLGILAVFLSLQYLKSLEVGSS
jgi:uncharacterized hydrophobic protein (TIGR00341 family)